MSIIEDHVEQAAIRWFERQGYRHLHEGVREVMGDDTLGAIAHDLVDAIRQSVTIDWTQKEAVRAKMQAKVKRLLRRHGYPPDQREAAVVTVIEQAEQVARHWAVAA